ncbi:MAG: hypothetical protein AAF922_16570 [Pseudomonadota bacterium]
MTLFVFIIALLFPSWLWAQSDVVLDGDLSLSVTIEDTDHIPVTQEMMLITIRGAYRRHIMLEKLQQPTLEGFNWAQLGPDSWREERINGKKVKIFERRMAVFPKRAGALTIGVFTHRLTLTDEENKWFEHAVTSAPVTVQVDAAPETPHWWFPVKRLKISDEWSNAPDQLGPNAGVLRVIRIEALGAMPDMIPLMPELHSPSGMIFAHPEKRLVELSPEGPVTYAFWRWTIRPTNGVSGIVEPFTLHYFDTQTRETNEVTIAAQRVAYQSSVSSPSPDPERDDVAAQAKLLDWRAGLLAGVVFLVSFWFGIATRTRTVQPALQRFAPLDTVTYHLIYAAFRRNSAAARRAAATLLARDDSNVKLSTIIGRLDAEVFGKARNTSDLWAFTKSVLKHRTNPSGAFDEKSADLVRTPGPRT